MGMGTAVIRRDTQVTETGPMETHHLERWDLDRGLLHISGMMLALAYLTKTPMLVTTWYGVRLFGRRFVYLRVVRDRDIQTYVALNQPWWLLVHAAREIHGLLLWDLARGLWWCGVRPAPGDEGGLLTWRALARACWASWRPW